MYLKNDMSHKTENMYLKNKNFSKMRPKWEKDTVMSVIICRKNLLKTLHKERLILKIQSKHSFIGVCFFFFSLEEE